MIPNFRTKTEVIVVLLLTLASVGFFGWLEIKGLKNLQEQVQAQSFPKTKGIILSGQVRAYDDSQGGVYYPFFTYRYTINGVNHISQRNRHGRNLTYKLWDDANHIVRAHPVGSEIEVFFNPNNLEDSLLSPGVLKWDVQFQFFLTMFLLLAAWGIPSIYLGTLNLLRPVGVDGGVTILHDGIQARVRWIRGAPDFLAQLSLILIGFVAFIWLALAKSEPLLAGEIALVPVIVVPLCVFAWMRRRVISGYYDIVVDAGSNNLSLPPTFQREATLTISFHQISGIELEKVGRSKRHRVKYNFTPTLVLNDGSRQRLMILEEERAVAFATWLAEKIGARYDGVLMAISRGK